MQLKLEVTKEAQTQVRELIKSQKPGTAVRVFAQAGGGGGGCCGSGGGGGCGCGEGGGSGTSFSLAFDRPRSGDVVVPIDGFQVVVDPSSASSLEGAKIDFVQELDTSGFTIVPANAPAAPRLEEGGGGGCGCGAGGGGCC
ncbi:MAG TPA: iron-sulfur cluster biosynthesis family protein [Thermoplasmata archaeon]|jgi:Fe-S cluster assembly iron-binding protein IscA|nr:iron-sulfur cluster biosynthesis family protein [Thermoplasmata archaeon]